MKCLYLSVTVMKLNLIQEIMLIDVGVCFTYTTVLTAAVRGCTRNLSYLAGNDSDELDNFLASPKHRCTTSTTVSIK